MVKTDIIVIGAGPVGLFTVFEAGLLGLNCTLIDNLDKPGGQCAELYPEKPIYDIPGVPFQTAQEHVDALLEQIKPFDYELHLSERVDSIEEIKHEDDNFWKVKTTEEKEFFSKNIFIAAGAGSFEPRRPPNIEDPDKFLTNGVEYAVRSVDKYKDKNIFIFGGGDSALDWTVELSKIAKSISLVHRRDAFRGAQHTEELMRNLVKENKVNLLTPYLIDSIIGDKKVDFSKCEKGKNEFEFELPTSKRKLTFKLLTHKDEKAIATEIKGLTKLNTKGNFSSTTNLKHVITSINGEYDNKYVWVFKMKDGLIHSIREYNSDILVATQLYDYKLIIEEE